MPDVDFSRNVDVYDKRHGNALSEPVVRALVAAASIGPESRILDVGAGTGRVAIPFAKIAREVVAIDISAEMLRQLRLKAGEQARLVSVVGAGQHLPCRSSQFDAVVVSRLLYLVTHWPAVLNEAARVLAPGGTLLHEWGNGECDEPWVQVREKARALFEGAGVEQPFHPGARNEYEVDDAIAALGFVRSAVVPIGPGPTLRLREFLSGIERGEFSYTWEVPEAVQKVCLPRFRAWCESTFDIDEPFQMPRSLRWVIYKRDMPSRPSL